MSSCTSRSPRPLTRRCAAGSVRPTAAPRRRWGDHRPGRHVRRCDAPLTVRARAVLERSAERATRQGSQRRFDVDEYIAGRRRRGQHWEQPAQTPAQSQPVRTGPPLSIFPVWGIAQLSRAVTPRDAPAGSHPASHRRRRRCPDAEELLSAPRFPGPRSRSSGVPIHVLRSNTVAQIKGALARVYGVEAPVDDPDDTEAAMQDVIEGIEQMQRTGDDVELTPQNSYVRRLRRQLVERHELSARSTGDEPNRQLVILRPAE